MTANFPAIAALGIGLAFPILIWRLPGPVRIQPATERGCSEKSSS